MRKKKEEQGKQRQQLQLHLQQISQITKLLQRNNTSFGTLKTLAIKETRHEESRRAIPEGDEDEDNNDDENESDSNKIKKEGKQMEEREQQRFVLTKSVAVAMSA